jgi:hypothetical protein
MMMMISIIKIPRQINHHCHHGTQHFLDLRGTKSLVWHGSNAILSSIAAMVMYGETMLVPAISNLGGEVHLL